MATRKPDAGTQGQGRSAPKIADLAPAGVDVVRRATDVLESELDTGLGAADRVQRRLREERKLDASDLAEAVTRFREDGHAVIELARGLASELRSESTDALAQRLFKDADRALDLALGMVELAPDLLNRLVDLAGEAGRRPAPAEGDKTTAAAGTGGAGGAGGGQAGAGRSAAKPAPGRPPGRSGGR